MSSTEIRAKEALIQVTVDSIRRSMKIRDLSIKPEVDRPTTRYVGEKRAQGDIDVKGYGVTFKANMRDHGWFDVLNLVQESERNGTAMPEVSIAVTLSYRAGGGSRTLTLSGGSVLFPDDINIPESDYLSTSWTGFFSELTST